MPSRAKSIQQLAAKYSRKAGIQFSKEEIEKLLRFYRAQVEAAGREKLDRSTFRDVIHGYFHITDDILMDRVFRCFDQDNDTYISMDEWVKGLSTYLHGPLDDRIKFCFNVYDLNNDGHISREEMFQLLKSCMVRPSIEEEADESIKDLVEITMRKVDKDQDGRASLADFKESVMEDTLLLELLGKCLPNDEHNLSFMAAMDDNNKCTSYPQNMLDPQQTQQNQQTQ